MFTRYLTRGTQMPHKIPPAPRESRISLVIWLKYVIQTLGIHSRAEWGTVLGITPQAIGNWLSGEKLPRAESLHGLLSTLEQLRYADRASSALDAWAELATHPLRDVWPSEVRIADARTLGHYVVTPLWEDLRLAVESQPPDTQTSLLTHCIGEVNRQRLRSRALRLGAANPRDAEQIRRVAPSAAKANPAVVPAIQHLLQRGSTLVFSNSPAT
jgi:hypothetical protein